MRIVRYERTFEQNEELGLNDMKTENYGEEKENKAAAAKANEEEQAEETAALLDKSEKEQLLQVGGRRRKTMVPFKDLISLSQMSPLQRAQLAELGQARTHLFTSPKHDEKRLLSPAHAAAAAGLSPQAAAAGSASAAGSRRVSAARSGGEGSTGGAPGSNGEGRCAGGKETAFCM